MEKKEQSPVLLLERAVTFLAVKAKENRVPLLCAFVVGALAHMFAFTNKLVNHDEVFCLFSKGATVSSGRWGLGALDSIFPNYSMPWIYGILTLVLMAAAICIIADIFSIRSKLLQGLLAGLIISFPSLTGTFGYMFTSSSYALSFLLAVVAVRLVGHGQKRYLLPAFVCMILSLSIYQSYISVAASMLVLLLIQQLLREDAVIPVIRRGFSFVAFLLLSLVGYFIATQAVLRITGTAFNSYASDSMTFQLSSVLNGVFLAYSNFIRFFTECYLGLVPTSFSGLMHGLCMAASIVLLLLWAFRQKKRDIPRILLLLALMAILPLAINCMYLITAADSIHTLVLYSFIAVYILAVIIAESCLPLCISEKPAIWCKNLSLNVISFTIAAVVVVNTYIANESYLNLYLRYENAYAFYTSLLTDIKQCPEFTEGTELAVIGNYDSPDYFEQKFEATNRITGVYGFVPDSYSADRFLEYYLGLSVPFASAEEIEKLKDSPEYTEMAAYPYYGSIQMIGDTLVVKLN